MATYGRGQMLGSGINPESFKLDYSGMANAAATQAQGVSDLGASIGGVIKQFGEAKEQRKKIDAETKASRAGIESAIKLGDALGFDVKGMLSPVLDRMDDPNTTPIEAAALGREASTQIANVLNLGFKAQDQVLEKARLTQDTAYKNEQLRVAQQNANSRAQTAIAAGGNAPPLVDVPLGDGSTQKMQWDRESQSYTPISVSGLSGASTSSLGNLPDALKPYAKDFEAAGAKYGVAPNILAAISMHETGNGTSSAFLNKNNAMGISNASGPVEVGSVAESIDKMARLLGKGINEGTGPYANAKSIADIANIYAPPGAGNDPRNLNQFWTQGVTSNIQKLSENKAEQVEPTTQNQGRIGFTPAEAKESEGTEMTLAEVEELTAKGVKVNAVPLGGGKFRVTESTFGNKPLVEVNTGQTDQQERSKKMDAMLFETKKQLEGASQNKDSITKMVNLLDEGVKTGFARETIMKFNRAFGRDVSDAETFRSVSGDVAMGFINLTKGAISDREMTYFTTTLAPNLGNTPEGNRKIGKFMLGAIQKAEKIEKVISEGLSEGKNAFDIDKEVRAIRNADDLLTDTSENESSPEKPQSVGDRLRALPPAQ